jgi:hypothetical protein
VPTYFGDVAPYCPISRDQPAGSGMPGGPIVSRQLPTRTSIPRVYDLPSALAAMNILRSIVNQVVRNTVINNVYTRPPTWPRSGQDRVIDLTRNNARWVEQKKLRVKRKYKYYGDESGEDKSWVLTERIERMVWYDKAWKTELVFEYGDKGEGEPQ